MKPNSRFQIFMQLIVLSNVFPIYCIYKYNWQFFEVIWLYWLEAVILVIFDISHLLMARINQGHANFQLKKIGMSFSLFFIRMLILLFYSLFMFVFIAFDRSDGVKQWALTIGMRNEMFNYALLSFFVVQYFNYVFNYIGNGKYRNAKPEDYFNFFTATTIVLHVVIVLGVVANAFLNKEKQYDSNKIFLLVFIVVKTIASLVHYWQSKPNDDGNNPIYI